MPLKLWLTTTFNLGIAAAVGLVLCVLALADIFHGEADVRLEWWMVRISLLLTACFIGATLRTLTLVRNTVASR